jgi:hypothetical protein
VAEARPETLWVHPHLSVRDSSIEGRGLFATDELPTGEVVLRLNGRLVSTKELGRLIERAKADPSQSYVDTLTIYEDAHLVLPPGTLIHFGNHSCDPNMWHVAPKRSPRGALLASEKNRPSTTALSREPPGSQWPVIVALRSVGAWSRVSTGACPNSGRDTATTGFRLSKLGSQPDETARIRRDWPSVSAATGAAR